jgi:hypothetical protein
MVLRGLNDPVDVERSFSIAAKGKQELVRVHALRPTVAETRVKPEPPAVASAA